ncbi:MAG: SDR family NAD(P)-dependent oxidoreductase [Acidimicrobiia bacterium]|nr:SDR family NAD(P)-dependent oxidoreductase [Acidimicrobiia bacterium]
MTFAGQRVLVTGASSGIGAALAEGFAARGAVVGLCARREDRLAEVLERVRKHSPESRSWTIDLADLSGIEAFARRVEDELGGVDVLVNNAGIPKRRHVSELTPETVDAVMAINYLSPIRLTLALLPGLIERSGRVVNISSVAARLSPPSEAAYAASKAALTVWSECMQVDLHDTGVRVHVVNPGVIDTELFHLPDNETSLADLDALPPSEVTSAVIDAIGSGAFETYVPPWFADIVAGKFQDPRAFLEGSAAWTAERVAALGQ